MGGGCECVHVLSVHVCLNADALAANLADTILVPW